jgi:hypothetical protein
MRWFLFAFVVGCGGSLNGSDAGVDASVDAKPAIDTGGGGDVTSDSPSSKPYDGTTGQPCTTDADCVSPGGPGLSRCSNSVFAPEDYYPTAVCIVPTCSPVTDTVMHFCDGPDDPSSPGVCVPDSSSMTGGICLPKCNYDTIGNQPLGCQAHDTCYAYTGAKEAGIGYCWAGCKQDGDCQDGQKCQTNEGLCVKGITPPTKAIGAACTKSDTNAGVCNCLYGTGNTGYCSSFCTVGDPTGCPTNMVCDSLELRTYGYSIPSTGMAGYCAVPCPDGGACPATSVCTNVFASGPDCIAP